MRYADQKIRIPNSTKHFPQWVSGGHSGIVIARGDGFTRYREYGRYPNQGPISGRVRSITIPNLEFIEGIPTKESITHVFDALLVIGAKAGSDDLRLSFSLRSDKYDDMMSEVTRWDESVPYLSNDNLMDSGTCHSFCEAVEDAGINSGFSSWFGGRFSLRLNPDNVNDAADKVIKEYEDFLD